jgi:hypothetical protein
LTYDIVPSIRIDRGTVDLNGLLYSLLHLSFNVLFGWFNEGCSHSMI